MTTSTISTDEDTDRNLIAIIGVTAAPNQKDSDCMPPRVVSANSSNATGTKLEQLIPSSRSTERA